MDEADIAGQFEERQIQASLASITHYEGESADVCVECGYMISSARQLAVVGTQLCTECAEAFERKEKRGML